MIITSMADNEMARFEMSDGDYFEVKFDGSGIEIRCMDGHLIVVPRSSNVVKLQIDKPWKNEA